VRAVTGMVMVMVMMMAMRVIVSMIVVAMAMGMFDRRFVVAAAAYRTHQSTSSSLTRNSSPPVTCS
jgi:hypothetical protein